MTLHRERGEQRENAMRHRRRSFWPVLVTLALIGCHHPTGPGITPVGPGSEGSPPPSDGTPGDRDVQSPTPAPSPQTPQAYRIEAFFGTGDIGYWGDGDAAVAATIYKPSSLAGSPDQRVYVSDFGFNMVRAVDLNTGIVQHVYGMLEAKDASESVRATDAPVAQPEGLAFDSKGRLYVAQYGYPGGIPGKIRMLDALGNTYTFAGGGDQPVTDGAYALDVSLSNPAGIAFDAQDRLYVAENGGNRILRIDPDRRVTVVAGTGEMGFSGDGGPATEAKLFWPQGLAIDSQGRVVIADEGNNRIRRIEKDGTIVTIAGNGAKGFGGDGGLATEATLNGPGAIAFDPAGNLLIADSNNNSLRRVTEDGKIQTFAGRPPESEAAASEEAPNQGDSGPALQAQLDYPYGLYVDKQGTIYVSDRGHRRVRMLKPASL